MADTTNDVTADASTYRAISPRGDDGVSLVRVSSLTLPSFSEESLRTFCIDIPTHVEFVMYDKADPAIEAETEASRERQSAFDRLCFCLPTDVAIGVVLETLRSLDVSHVSESNVDGVLEPATNILERLEARMSAAHDTVISSLRLNKENRLESARGPDVEAERLWGFLSSGERASASAEAESFYLPGKWTKVTVSSGESGHFFLTLKPTRLPTGWGGSYTVTEIRADESAKQSQLGSVACHRDGENTLRVTVSSLFSQYAKNPHERGWTKEQIHSVADAVRSIFEGLSRRQWKGVKVGKRVPLNEQTIEKIDQKRAEVLDKVQTCCEVPIGVPNWGETASEVSYAVKVVMTDEEIALLESQGELDSER